MATNDQEELEYLFAQTIFRCGLPLSLSELEYVKEDIKVERNESDVLKYNLFVIFLNE